MYESEARYDEPQAGSRFDQAMTDLMGALDRAEKNWEVVAQRLTRFLGETVPTEEEARLKAAAPIATSSAVRGLYDLVERVRDFSERIGRVSQRLEL